MLVMEAVMIQPPYKPDNCVGKPGEKNLTERVQKVLSGILKKLDAVSVQ